VSTTSPGACLRQSGSALGPEDDAPETAGIRESGQCKLPASGFNLAQGGWAALFRWEHRSETADSLAVAER